MPENMAIERNQMKRLPDQRERFRRRLHRRIQRLEGYYDGRIAKMHNHIRDLERSRNGAVWEKRRVEKEYDKLRIALHRAQVQKLFCFLAASVLLVLLLVYGT